MIVTVTLNPSLDEWVHVPRLQPGKLHRATAFARYPGGKGINVSRVVQELGARTRAYALAGGEDGHVLERLLKRLGIPYQFIPVPGSTRNNYKILSDASHALTEINSAGPPVSARALRALERRLLTWQTRPRHVVLSGSLPPRVPPTIYRRWINMLRQRGIRSVLDSSGEAMRQGMAGAPWLVKPNRQEAEELLGERLKALPRVVRGAQELVRRGAQVAILSLGAEGAVMASSDPAGAWLARPPAVKTESAVGAGDSLVGGFLVGWQRTRTLVGAFRLGIASGTATALTPGTELCRRADVERLVGRVTITRVA